MDPTSNLAPCIVCGNNVTADCRCRCCDGRLHAFCGVPEGLEGHGPKYLCSVDCQSRASRDVSVAVASQGETEVAHSASVANEVVGEDLVSSEVVEEDSIGSEVGEEESVASGGTDDDIGGMDRNSLRSLLRRCPLKSFFRMQRWSANDVQAAKEKDITPVTNYVSRLCNLPSCVDPDNIRFCKCTCLKSISPEMIPSIATVLGKFFFYFFLLFFINFYLFFFVFSVSFALLSKDIRQTLLKERLANASARKVEYQSLYKKRSRSSSDLHRLYYRLSVPGFDIPLCGNSFRNFYVLLRRSWKSLTVECKKGSGPIAHRNLGNNNRGINSCRAIAKPSVVSFLEDVCKSYGEAYATRFVREVTGLSLRQEEENLVELPSRFTKRKLYAEYCFSRGYKIKANAKGSYGKVSSYELREYDELLWPEDSIALTVCSWKDFLSIWKEEFSYMKIRNPCEDTCAECFKIRNSFRVLDRMPNRGAASMTPQNDALDAASDSDFSRSSLSDAEELADENAALQQEFPVEAIIIEASNHAISAQNQRLLASSRIAEAKETSQLPFEERR